jgi:hypothetical protein
VIYGPFADLGPPQALVLKHDILANERRMMWSCKQSQRVQFDLAWGPRPLMMLLPA